MTLTPASSRVGSGWAAIASHPVPRLLEAGVHVTVNSDDPAYFGGYVADNYLALASGLGLGLADLAALASNSVNACLR